MFTSRANDLKTVRNSESALFQFRGGEQHTLPLSTPILRSPTQLVALLHVLAKPHSFIASHNVKGTVSLRN